ncbi:MAG: chorismate synthase [Chlamydiales bacterium]|jgi:chorismate synthase
MSSNAFGKIFKITTWGESHGKAIGVVIDGCPAGLEISNEEINVELERRRPGRSSFVSPRKELDIGEIYSGVFEGKTTGAPISIIIANGDADSSKYAPIKDLLRPGHANFTYLEKYGCFDYKGGGRSSARETAGRVAAGAVAKKLLDHFGIKVCAYLKQVHSIVAVVEPSAYENLQRKVLESPVFCPDSEAEKEITTLLQEVIAEGDSVGGVVEVCALNVPTGLGDPVYDKLEALIASAMMSLPASKGVEVGSGFSSVRMKGSEHNDQYINVNGDIRTETNYAGGVLGGISNGMPLITRVAFKPTSSIMRSQETLDKCGVAKSFDLPKGSRHDPCVTIRAVPVVEAMMALVLVDALLMKRLSKLELLPSLGKIEELV